MKRFAVGLGLVVMWSGVAVLAVACSTTRNPEFCCTSAEDCASVGVDETARECASGFVCHESIHTCILEGCGDGIIAGDELCDDGNNLDGDGCNAKCTEAACFVPATHPTLEAALADADCPVVTVASGTYLENVVIDRDVDIVGVGASPVVLDGQGRDSVVTIASGIVSIENVTITNGRAAAGGGISNRGTLTLRRSRIEANTAGTRGGGIYNEGGGLTLEATVVARNHVVPIGTVAAGGGIYNAAGPVSITGGSIEANTIKPATAIPGIVATGGGLASDAGNVVLVDAVVTANSIEVDGRPGRSISSGGGVYLATGELTLTRGAVSSNTITALGESSQILGGGVAAPRVSAVETHVDDNSARGFVDIAVWGGGFYLVGRGDSSFLRSTISRNLVEVTLAGEGGELGGGGGMIVGSGNVIIDQTTISNNKLMATGVENTARGGGLYWRPDDARQQGSLSVIRSGCAANQVVAYYGSGGCVAASLIVGHRLDIEQSSITNNELSAVEGAGGAGLHITAVDSDGFNDAAVVNSTISGNSATSVLGNSRISGGVDLVGSFQDPNRFRFTLASSTLARNSAQGDPSACGGLCTVGAVRSSVMNTIIAENIGPSPDCFPGFGSSGYNLIGDSSLCVISGMTESNKLGSPAMLGPLADNGGGTLTHALAAGSAALDSANPSGCSDNLQLLIEDQRGLPRHVGGRCDIGAYER